MYMLLYTSCYIRKPVKTELTFVFESLIVFKKYIFLFGAIFVTTKVDIVTVYWNGHSVDFRCILTCGKSKTPI